VTRIRRTRPLLLVAALALLLQSAGCASLSRTGYVHDPGVSATITTIEGESFPATFIGVENGRVVFDRSYPKTEALTVVERDGEPVVLLGRLALGTAVEIREFDIVVRERHPFSRIDEISVATGAYFGWGALLGAILTFGFIELALDDI
jgi:hypothetical protein